MSAREPVPVPMHRLRREPGERIIDISPPVSAASEVWKGDTPFSSRRVMALADGCSCNVTTIETTVHVGAHVDAPLHFSPSGLDAAGMDLGSCLGSARVVRMPRRGGITREDIEALDLAGVERLLVATRKPGAPVRFRDPFAFLEPDAARAIAQALLRLFGIDTFSVDERDSKTLESHHALMEGGVTILEGLDLSAAAPGDYELIALPLRLVGSDASPVRAVLRDTAGPVRRGGLPSGARARSSPGPAGGRMPASPPGGSVQQLPCIHGRIELVTGDRVRVALDQPANVMLLDDANFRLYSDGDDFSYFGGWSEVSPVEIAAPGAGAWNLVVDPEDEGGEVGVKVEILR